MLEKFREFLKTKKGRMITIIIGVLIIVLVVLLILSFVLKGMQTTETPVVTKSPDDSQAVEEKAEEEIEEVEEEVSSEVDSFEVYEYKDPFKPLVSAPATATATADTTSTDTTDTGDSEVLILVLEDIYTENDVVYASIRYGSTVYKVTEGDRVNDSPYQVVSIEEESVTLLYGEDMLEIKLGEEIIK